MYQSNAAYQGQRIEMGISSYYCINNSVIIFLYKQQMKKMETKHEVMK